MASGARIGKRLMAGWSCIAGLLRQFESLKAAGIK